MSALIEKFIESNGITTHYWETGEGSPLILIHGGGAGADAWGNWHKIMGNYAEQGFRVIAYDMVGYGLSSRPDPAGFEYNHEARVRQLLDFMDELELSDVSLIGNSLGGATSTGAALAAPDKVHKLVLMGSGGRRKPNADSASFKALYTYNNNDREHMRQIIRNLTNEQFEIDEEMIGYRLKISNDPETNAAYQATMANLRKGLFIEDEELQTIRQKTFIVHGRKDNQVPVEISFDLVRQIPHSWLYVMPNCGHWAMIEYPEEFSKITIDFLKNY